MNILVLILALVTCSTFGVSTTEFNVTDGNASNYKDMYVIKATTYQIGILSNETIENNTAVGDQESVTFFRKNGSDIDLSSIPSPLLTNITSQQVVGVVPVVNSTAAQPWVHLNTAYSYNTNNNEDGTANNIIQKRNLYESEEDDSANLIRSDEDDESNLYKRSAQEKTEPEIKVVKGSAVILEDAGINSINLPPLLTFKSNISTIPVPIPNTSVIHYTELNTVVKSTKDE